MPVVNPYFTFNGNCEAAFTFYRSIFGGEFRSFSRFKDFPQAEGQTLPAEALEKIMHVSLPISEETILMGSDANPRMGSVSIGQHLSISVDAETKADAERIFTGLAQGGRITMPMANTFWGAYFGMLIDKFGVIWMVNSEQTPAA
jgi:PhnB protein